MSLVVLLDAGPLGMISNPNAIGINKECYEWVESLVINGARIFVPEIADYEIRRELLRANKTIGLARLDSIKSAMGYLPMTTGVMLKAAELWAEARKSGNPTADP
jgi:predicted nucleic acid-binding protein